MSTQQDSSVPSSTTKKFGKGEREIPHHTQKAKKYYPADDESKPKRVSPIFLIGSDYRSGTFDENQLLTGFANGPRDVLHLSIRLTLLLSRFANQSILPNPVLPSNPAVS